MTRDAYAYVALDDMLLVLNNYPWSWLMSQTADDMGNMVALAIFTEDKTVLVLGEDNTVKKGTEAFYEEGEYYWDTDVFGLAIVPMETDRHWFPFYNKKVVSITRKIMDAGGHDLLEGPRIVRFFSSTRLVDSTPSNPINPLRACAAIEISSCANAKNTNALVLAASNDYPIGIKIGYTVEERREILRHLFEYTPPGIDTEKQQGNEMQ